jgi:hypothetical protein
MAERQLPKLCVGAACSSRPDRELGPIFLPRSKTNLVNPPPEQEHGKAFAVARRNRFHFMAENCPKRGCSGDKLGASISGFGLCEGLGSRAEPDYPQSRLKPTGRGK